MMNLKPLLAGFAIGVFAAFAPSCGAPKCSPSNCPTGCCDAMGQCQLGSSNVACGGLGRTCQMCSLGQSCNLGTCLASGTGGGNGGTGGGSSQGGGTATGGGTSTGGGTATGGGGGTCDGCFSGGMCFNRANTNNNTLCGQNGVQCATCSGGQQCVNYVCVTPGTGGGGTTGGGGGTTGGGGGTTGGGGGTTGQPIGGACSTTSNCQAGLTCKLTTATDNHPYPGGYCSKPCTNDTDCGSGAECIGGPQSALQFWGEPQGFCAQSCLSAGSVSNCRATGGYTCEFNAAGQPGVCWLDPIPNFNGGGIASNTGAPCTTDTCQPAGVSDLLEFCFKASLPDGGFSGWTQGYCSADCRFDNVGSFCGTNGACVPLGPQGSEEYVCLQTCTAPGTRANCRSGYFCAGLQTGDSVCYPDCTITGCGSGGTCNSTTGACM